MGWILEEQEPPHKQGRFVRVAYADTMTEAELIRGVLLEHRIAATATPAGMASIASTQGAVWVPLNKREEALDVLRELWRGGMGEQENGR